MAKPEVTTKTESKNETSNKVKTSCPVTRAQFKEKAEPISIKIGESMVVGEVKEFATGSLGWNTNSKIIVQVDGKPCSVQVGINLILVGSKDAQ